MKKILYIIMCAVLAFASCSKEELTTTDGQNPKDTYTFNVSIEEPDHALKTKANVNVNRYVLELYEGNLNATPIKLQTSDGVFTMELKKNTSYMCLFWADGGSGYDVSDLKAVKQLNETERGTMAYSACHKINTKNIKESYLIGRAVGELLFIDNNGLVDPNNTLKITYPHALATLNVGDSTITYTPGTTVRTIANIRPPQNKTDAFASELVLAPKVAGKLIGLKLMFNNEPEKTVALTIIQANWKTKITGEYRRPN